MEDDEKEQLTEIQQEVKGSHAQLGRIDERTRNIENKVDSLNEDIDKNKKDINELESSVKRNTTVINAVTVGLSGLLIWVADKLRSFGF